MKPLTPAEALRLVATLTFRPFQATDWMGFAGCSSANPLLAETSEFVVIIDEHPDDRRPCIYICNDEQQHHQCFYLGDSE